MNSATIAAIVFACLAGAVCLGKLIRRRISERYLDADTKDVVKLCMGLVATMAALLLGLLVSSAKGSYDATRDAVTQLAGKAAVLDRVFTLYGPEATEAKSLFRAALEESNQHMWPAQRGASDQVAPDTQAGNALYFAIMRLSPRDDTQRSLKTQAATLIVELGQVRSLLQSRSASSISIPLLVMVVAWLVIISLGFSVLAPSNAVGNMALLLSALAVASAIFLILELDRPFDGLVQISSKPIQDVLSRMLK